MAAVMTGERGEEVRLRERGQEVSGAEGEGCVSAWLMLTTLLNATK